MLKPLPDEKEILQRLSKNDTRAFTALYHHYSAALYKTILWFLKDEEDADELLQVVFVKVWENRHKVALSDHAGNYLFRMTRNSIIDFLRLRARENKLRAGLQENSLSVLENTIEKKLEEKKYLEYWHKAVAQLPEQQKKIYSLTIEGYSYKEMEALLGISRFTVKKHLELARKTIRTYMNQQVPLLLFISVIDRVLCNWL